jgi:hypothetical protein
LAYLLPEMERVQNFDKVEDNNYYLISGGGFPSIYHHLKNAIEEVNSIPKYDYLILCLDADESSVDERVQQITNFIEKENLGIINSDFKIIVQNRCLETWFLGNRVVYPRQPDGETFREYAKFYNVSVDDPELMGLYRGFKSISLFHYSYLKEMLAERNVRYTKYNPQGVIEVPYIEQLIARVEDTNHLRSLKDFFDFCHAIGEKIVKGKM